MASTPEFGSDPGGLEFLPNQELPLNWDQRHVFHLSLRLAEPQSWAGSVTFSYGSGFPWTPNDRYARKQDPLLENSMRLPATYDLTLQGERQINFYGQQLTLFMQAHNLISDAFYQDYTCADLSQTKAGIGWQPMHDVCQAIVEYGRLLKSQHA